MTVMAIERMINDNIRNIDVYGTPAPKQPVVLVRRYAADDFGSILRSGLPS